MADVDRDKMREIKAFPELVRYLHDELNWPIQPYDFEDLFFEYQPGELGIDAKSAAKIEEIKQLRPMVDGQPWGIFFVKFAPKRLPIVALRRILSSLAIKKRASAKISEMATWQLNDLLFISNYGENDQRQITFAHFSQDEQSTDLPTLRVLGWDDADTASHIDHVQNELQQKLSWPKNERDIELWQKNWASAFTLRHREVITTSRDLAVRLAALARQIRNRANAILAIETETGPISKLHRAFREALIHDLSEEDFADMYAQTIAYGLLSARLANPKGRTADELAIQVPVTNPFLKELMETFLNIGGRKGKAGGVGIDFDELGISEVVELLNNSNMEAVVRDFGDKNPQEDPVIHFYELFLKEYDAKKRMQRGVFYTPRPVVSYIVRSVDELLRTEFGLEDGLADTTTWGEMATRHKNLKIPDGLSPNKAFVQILDPATGTGTFLVEAIDVIYRTMKKKWESEAGGPLLANIQERWNEYVPKHLLPRLHGYELLMAPYAIAHLKIGLKLYETGYRFGSDERARIYLTNSLEPPQDFSGKFEFMMPALAHEAQAVNAIKKNHRFTVVIGNPPYSVMSSNLSDQMRSIVDEYRFVDGTRIQEKSMLRLEMQLQDDYIKFIRISQNSLETAGSGVLGLVINHSFIDNPTLRGLRQNLCKSFSELRICDLHGNSRKKNDANPGEANENVFDIQQGVAILIGKHFSPPHASTILQADVHGTRSFKYYILLNPSVIKWTHIKPSPPLYQFFGQNNSIYQEFQSFLNLIDVMPFSSGGIMSGRDDFVFDFDRLPLVDRITEFCDKTHSDEWVRSRFNIKDASGYKLRARRRIVIGKSPTSFIISAQFRPFDYRYVAYSPGFITADQIAVMRNLTAGDNIALVTTRQTKECWGVFVTRNVIERKFVAAYDPSSVFPLFLISRKTEMDLQTNRSVNFSVLAVNTFNNIIKTKQGLADSSQLFDYIYAVFNSEKYRSRYAKYLTIDYPRVPIPKDKELLAELILHGRNLILLHLMDSPKLQNFITHYDGPDNPKVSRVGWSNNIVWLDAAATKKGKCCSPGSIGFHAVPETVWNFHIGGHQVCEKWLKDRKSRVLSQEDIEHYQKIIVALSETIRIMAEIDKVIEKHGGWPGAFQPISSS